MLLNSTLDFIDELKANNNRQWFQQNRNRYERAKINYLEFAEMLLVKMQNIDPTLRHLQPKDTVYRIYRDIRFSNDKTPYKTYFGVVLCPEKTMSRRPGYYIHVENNGCFLAGGIYKPQSDILKKVRTEISNFYPDLVKIVEDTNFKARFNGFNFSKSNLLMRPPQGFRHDNQAIEYLKLKSYEVISPFDISQVTSIEGIDKLIDNLKYLKPLNDFLNSSFD